MYSSFYGFTAKPFHITPDPDFLFFSPKHKEALACMEFGVMDNVAVTLISGEIGIGKTTLIYHLLKELDDDIYAACINNTNLSPEEFLILVAQAFSDGAEIAGKSQAIKSIQNRLETIHARNQTPLLIIDDAQSLSLEVLGEVRWLSNLQNKHGMLLQIMLVGQPELRTKLQHPSMASLAQRIGISYHLKPFTREEAGDYILHRIKTVQGPADLITPGAIDLIYNTTQGIPRAINLLCDNALVYGFADELTTIDIQTVQQAIDEIGGYGVGFGRVAEEWESNAISEPAPAVRTSAAMSGENDISHRLNKLETRVELLDRVLGLYTRELHGVIKTQLMRERSQYDKLLMKFGRLMDQYEAMQSPRQMPSPDVAEASDQTETNNRGTAGRLSLLPQKKTGQD
jgi:general secretion pathway protein A